MKTEEIVDAARNAGFSSSEIMHRLAAFKRLINSAAYAEREKFTNTQEFVTLPRAVAEQALEALFTYKPMVTGVTFQHGLDAMQALRAALEQPQVEQEICCKIWSVNRIDDLGKIVDSSGRLIATVYGSQADKIVACHNSYTNPQPKREPLTDDDVERLWYQNRGGLWYQNQGISLRFARAIEAAHNIKDTQPIRGLLLCLTQ